MASAVLRAIASLVSTIATATRRVPRAGVTFTFCGFVMSPPPHVPLGCAPCVSPNTRRGGPSAPSHTSVTEKATRSAITTWPPLARSTSTSRPATSMATAEAPWEAKANRVTSLVVRSRATTRPVPWHFATSTLSPATPSLDEPDRPRTTWLYLPVSSRSRVTPTRFPLTIAVTRRAGSGAISAAWLYHGRRRTGSSPLPASSMASVAVGRRRAVPFRTRAVARPSEAARSIV